jgi:hypothetical protein
MKLGELEAELRAILVPYEDELETAEIYGMEVLRRPGAKAHDWFAGVQAAGDRVKFNFLPMHTHPELLAGASPALLKRRTGASVFKLAAGDEGLLEELELVVARGFEVYMGRGGDARPTSDALLAPPSNPGGCIQQESSDPRRRRPREGRTHPGPRSQRDDSGRPPAF